MGPDGVGFRRALEAKRVLGDARDAEVGSDTAQCQDQRVVGDFGSFGEVHLVRVEVDIDDLSL